MIRKRPVLLGVSDRQDDHDDNHLNMLRYSARQRAFNPLSWQRPRPTDWRDHAGRFANQHDGQVLRSRQADDRPPDAVKHHIESVLGVNPPCARGFDRFAIAARKFCTKPLGNPVDNRVYNASRPRRVGGSGHPGQFLYSRPQAQPELRKSSRVRESKDDNNACIRAPANHRIILIYKQLLGKTVSAQFEMRRGQISLAQRYAGVGLLLPIPISAGTLSNARFSCAEYVHRNAG